MRRLPLSSSRRWAVAAPLIVALRRWAVAGPLIVALVLGAIVAWAVPGTAETLGFLGMVSGFLTAGVLMFRRSVGLERRERNAWRHLTVGLFLVATGVAVVGVSSVLGYPVPAFGPTDMFFLAAYGTLILALYRLARSDGEGRDWVLTILDALVGAIALSTLVWTAFYHELVDSLQGAPVWDQVVGGIYPLLDVAAVIALMILVIRRSHFHLDGRLSSSPSGWPSRSRPTSSSCTAAPGDHSSKGSRTTPSISSP